jgi:hypothetical protein
MHTATRLAAPLIARARTLNPAARLCAYGLYAPLNDEWLRAQGIHDVLGPEAEAQLVAMALGGARAAEHPGQVPRLRLIAPDRGGLPPLSRYAALQMPDGSRRVAGSTDATRGCKHLCRHCPIVPVYQGQFRVVPVDVVAADVRAQVEAGAQHISLGDPDFLNGPAHARRVVEMLASSFPGLTYDVTIKIEHLLRHSDMLAVLRGTGCLFITSAVESVDDTVLARLAKGHTRADFAAAVARCREAGVTLVPTFVPFTPWTTLDGYLDLLEEIDRLDLVEHVAPIQLAIRLLVTARSALLELEDLRAVLEPFDAASLVFPWRHADSRVDELQSRVMTLVAAGGARPRSELFDAIADVAREAAGRRPAGRRRSAGAVVPTLTEPWYCCAEPAPAQLGAI